MLRRGCSLLLLLFGALFALYYFFFTRCFEWPGNLIAAGLGSLFGAVRRPSGARRAASRRPMAS